MSSEDTPLTMADRVRITQEIADDILGYGPIEPFLRDPDITEIMVNGPHDIWIERTGKLQHVDGRFNDEAHLRRTIEKIVARIGRRIDESSPMCDARLPDGSRVNAVVPPLALDGSLLTIRKFSADPFTVDDLVVFGTFSQAVADLLERLRPRPAQHPRLRWYRCRQDDDAQRAVVVHPSRRADHHDRGRRRAPAAPGPRAAARVAPANIEGKGEVKIRDLVRNSLRMRPDRIVVGEIRDAAALDMLQAMNTGHDGSISTLHANTPRDALSRLETMVMMSGMDLPGPRDPRAGLQRGRPDHPADPAQGRHPPDHLRDRGRRHGGRHHHAAGPVHVRLRRRLRPAPAARWARCAHAACGRSSSTSSSSTASSPTRDSSCWTGPLR